MYCVAQETATCGPQVARRLSGVSSQNDQIFQIIASFSADGNTASPDKSNSFCLRRKDESRAASVGFEASA
jgi:hypothetical protein